MDEQSKESIQELEFLSFEARLAYAEGVWGSVRSEVREQALVLMKRYGLNEYRALRVVLGHTEVQMARIFGLCLPTYLAIEMAEIELCQWTSLYSQIRSVLARSQPMVEGNAGSISNTGAVETAIEVPRTRCSKFQLQFGTWRNRYRGRRQ